MRSVFGDVEVSGFHGALGHGVGNEEEVKLAVDDLGLLDEALVNVSSLGWVVNELSLRASSLLEESLADALVDNDESNFRRFNLLRFLLTIFAGLLAGEPVLLRDDSVELLKLVVNDLLTHGITDTITVDEDVFGHLPVELAVAVEGTLEVVRQHI